jgi:L-threonylcarbamoyladenylate synthase
MKTKLLLAEASNTISHAVDVLMRGGVVAFPTDTVYGLGVLASQAESIERLYSIKGREQTKAIAVLIADTEQMEQISAQPNEKATRLAQRFWPGPLTFVLPRHPTFPEGLSPDGSIGVRVPNHPVALALLKEAGPMGVTSANLSGKANASSAKEVLDQLDGRVHLIIDGGKTPGGVPSTVVDMSGELPNILRPGPISEAELLATLA